LLLFFPVSVSFILLSETPAPSGDNDSNDVEYYDEEDDT
jgi:hypothetical protein